MAKRILMGADRRPIRAKTFFGIEQIPRRLLSQSNDWHARFGLDVRRVRHLPVVLGMDEFKDALEPWRMA